MRWVRSVALAMLAALAVLVAGRERSAGIALGKAYFPNATVITQDGKSLQFFDDLIKDKVFVISFLYTSCRDICPLATSRLAELQEKLGDSMGRDVFFYSISIDPETDTPERLKEYANTFQAGPGWLFLTGTPHDIDAIRHKLGERSRVLSEHRNEILLGNGASGRMGQEQCARRPRQPSLDGSVAWTRSGARRGTAHTGHKALKFDFASQPGQALFKRLCAGCHTVGRGDRVGPDLAGAMGQRGRDWLVSFIANPEKMRREKDPIALGLVAKSPTVRMPALGISDPTRATFSPTSPTSRRSTPSACASDSLLALTTHGGSRLAPELVKDQPVAVVFGFTHCLDVCPTTLLDWSNVLGGLGADGDRLKVLFVSVDGERDTPEALKAYLASFDPRIVALTGSAAEIAIAARAFDAFYAKVA